MKSELNVFRYGFYNKRLCFANIKQFFTNIRYAWQRATRGYCDWDVWDLDAYYTRLIRDSIFHLANTSSGYPSHYVGEGKTYEDWQNYLCKISALLNNSIDRSFEDNQVYKNKYEDEYSEYLTNKYTKFVHGLNSHDSNQSDFATYNESEEERQLFENYQREELNLYDRRVADRETAFRMMLDEWGNLWD